MTIDPAINKAMENVGLDNLNRTIISNEGDGIIKGGGAGTKTNVNVGKSGQTSSIQSDLQAVDETGQDADIDYTTSEGSNLKSQVEATIITTATTEETTILTTQSL